MHGTITRDDARIDVLDHGFVRLVDHMGDDLSIVRAARVSYDATWRAGGDEGSDARLIAYLWRNAHTSPFEAVELQFEVKAPIFVLRQWQRRNVDLEHDGTAAVIYGMRHPRVVNGAFDGGSVVILDWDIRSLGAAGAWLRHIDGLYREWIQRAHPRMSLDGFHIEKPAMGLRLLELAAEQGIAAQGLDTEWVEWGKDGRALAAEPHVAAGRVKFARNAYDKAMDYRGAVHNHALAQITGFRTFDRKAAKRADDLADGFVYAVLRCLGDGRVRQWDRLRRVA